MKTPPEVVPPPRWAQRLLEWALPGDDIEFVLGDLEELFRERWLPQLGRRRARLRYAVYAMRSVWSRFRSPRPAALRPTTAAPQVSGIDHLRALRQDVGFAMRGFARRPAFMATVVATLAMAIGANTAMFSVVNAVLLRPLPFPEPDELVTIWQATAQEPDGRFDVSVLNFRDWQSGSRSIEAMASFRAVSGWTLTGMGDAENLPTAQVSEDFFRTLGPAFVRGRAVSREAATLEGPREAVIGESFWRDRLASDPDVLDRSVTLEGIPHRIVGIAPAAFDYPDGAEVWVGDQPDTEGCGRGCVGISVVARLAQGAGPDVARSELEAVVAGLIDAGELGEDARVNVVPLDELLVGDVRAGLLVLLGAVVLVLLIACANIANLLLADGSRRAGEMATRAAIGADRTRLVRQLLTESALLATVGGLAGIGLGHLTIGAARSWVTGVLPRADLSETLSLHPSVLGMAVLLAGGAAVLFGLAPAMALSRSSLSGSIRRSARGAGGRGAGGRRARAGFMVAQVALTVVLLLGTGLLLRTVGELRSAPIGFQPEDLITFSVGVPGAEYDAPAAVAFHQQLQARLADLPQVLEVGAALGTPMGGVNIASSIRFFEGSEAAPAEDGGGHSTLLRVVDPGYLETIGIPLLAGRGLEGTDGIEDPGVVLVSKATAARWWPASDPLGKEIRIAATVGLPERPRRVIGVVGDVRSTSVRSDVQAEIYIPHSQSGSGSLRYVVRPTPGAGPLVAPIRGALADLDPQIPLGSLTPLEEALAAELARPRLYSILLGAFSTFALTLAGLGLYGIVSYQVSQRTRELGLRVAVGARRRDVIGLVLRQGMGPALVGVVIGLSAAWFSAGVLQSLLYNVEIGDRLAWGGTVVTVIGVVLTALVLPARRAADVDPVRALGA